MSTTLDTPAINGPCNCSGLFDDPEVDQLRAMVPNASAIGRLPWLRLPEEVAG